MSNIAIHVEHLSKKYRLGQRQSDSKYRTLSESLLEWVSAPWRRLSRKDHRPSENIIWALKDISFDVQQGEVMGIIGRNGAGKSTLLKILSRITEPTAGSVDLYGRVGSLLEVGTGFHPELTGRENIYLNGAILGMKRTEIERKFDEIVDFAEVERFIDTPVKHYSSGMYLRLAFAVAAHLEPDILLVDEVLAVGDAQFQKKCLGKMGQVAQQGRTVLFVSHNLAAISSMCKTIIVLESGRLKLKGPTAQAIDYYQSTLNAQEDESNDFLPRSAARFRNPMIAPDHQAETSIQSGEPFSACIDLIVGKEFVGYDLFCILMDSLGNIVVHAHTDNRSFHHALAPGALKVKVSFPSLWLKPGLYSLHFKLIGAALDGEKIRLLSDHVPLSVSGEAAGEALLGVLTPPLQWAIHTTD
jgi:lipopolysaccharide transport system ATP-binding protein